MQDTVTGLDLASPMELGAARRTALEQPVDDSYKGEAVKAAHYLACARQAEREGFPEIGCALARIAEQELEHAARFAELNARVDDSTQANLARLLKETQASCSHQAGLARRAEEERLAQVCDCYAEASREEARSAQIIDGLLRRYF
ncbi:MAG TPA: rubrerythrin family protein [Firmicutes bacterium]|nr:rubrerythrin family protein [Bacillota bacterium]